MIAKLKKFKQTQIIGGGRGWLVVGGRGVIQSEAIQYDMKKTKKMTKEHMAYMARVAGTGNGRCVVYDPKGV